MVDDYGSDINTTGVLAIGASATGVLETINDQDYFKVTLLARTVYEFRLVGGTLSQVGTGQPAFDLWDPSLNGGAGGMAHTYLRTPGARTITFIPDASGTFYLGVRAFGLAGSYEVSARVVGVDDHSDGWLAAAADQVPLGGQATGSIELAGDNDVFALALKAGVTYRVHVAGTLGATGATIVPQLSMSNGSVTFGPTDPSITGADATLTAKVDGVVYASVSVSASGGAATRTGDYVIGYEAVADDAGATAANGAVLAAGIAKGGVLEVNNDVDVFKISLAAGQPTLVRLVEPTGQASFSVTDARGTVLALAPAFQLGGSLALVWTPAVAGDYLVQVAGKYDGVWVAGTGYTVQATPLAPDDFSADARTVGLLTAGGTVRGVVGASGAEQGMLGANGDVDWIRTVLTAGDTYNFGISSARYDGNGTGGLAFKLVNASGASVGTNNGGVLSYKAASSGDYFLVVDGSRGTVGNSYALTSYVASADTLPADASTRALLLPNQTLRGTIDSPTDRDWIRVEFTAGQTVRYAVTAALVNPGVVTLALVDASGAPQYQAQTSSSGGAFSFTAPKAGSYFLQVSADGLNTGNYTLGAADGAALMPDIAGPVLAGSTAPTGANNRAAGFTLTLDENVLRGDATITLRLASGATVDTFDVATSTHLAIAGSTLQLTLSASLAAGTDYVLTVPAGALKDASGNLSAPISWTVRTADADQQLVGGGGNDVFRAGSGNDRIDGAGGIDTVSYVNYYASDFAVARTGATLTVTQGQLGGRFTTGDVDVLTNVERLQFADVTRAFDIDGVAGQTYRLYQAAFGRVPDSAGLGYWIAQADKGLDQHAISKEFIDSKEFIALYGATASNEVFLNRVYQNVLHRAPDAAGLAYWLDGFAHGLERANALLAFSESAENQAATLVGIKDSIYFTQYA